MIELVKKKSHWLIALRAMVLIKEISIDLEKRYLSLTHGEENWMKSNKNGWSFGIFSRGSQIRMKNNDNSSSDSKKTGPYLNYHFR